MTHQDFCHWLSGFLDASGDEGLCKDQVSKIKEKLASSQDLGLDVKLDMKLDHDKIAKALGATRTASWRGAPRGVYC